MALFPLQAIFQGDFVVQLVPVDDGDPMRVIAEKVAYHAVGRRVAAQAAPMRVLLKGERIADDLTVGEAGIGPMDVIQVGYE